MRVLSTAWGWLKWGIGLALGWSDKQADRAVEHDRETTKRVAVGGEVAKAAISGQVEVITTGMRFWPFWVMWSMAAFPTCGWFGWGMLDSWFNGALPDVAALPPQLAAIADKVFDSIFYSGATVGGAQAATKIANSLIAAWGRK